MTHTISSGSTRVSVQSLGATLREVVVDGRELIWSFGADDLPFMSQGQHLLPWPNRIRDGRYRFDGRDHQLPITDLTFGNAIHGLAHGVAW